MAREGVILGSFLELIDYDIEKERQASEFKIDLFVKRPLSLRFIFRQERDDERCHGPHLLWCNRVERDHSSVSLSVSASTTALIRIPLLRLFPPLGTSYVVAEERRKRGGRGMRESEREEEGVWPGLRGGLRGGGRAARGSPVGTDNEKGKLFRFLPLIPLLALGARPHQ